VECTQFNGEVFVPEQITVPRLLEHSLKKASAMSPSRLI